MPYGRMQPLRQLFGMNPAEENNDINLAIPGGLERQREAGVLANMDARTNASLAADLEEANAVRQARNMGYGGSFPLREAAENSYQQALQKLILPKQLELQTAREENEAAAARQQMMINAQNQRLATSQAGMDRRATENRNFQRQMAQDTGRIKGPSWLGSLFGIGGNDTPAPASAGGGPQIGERKVLPNGIEVMWDGNGWTDEF